MVFSGRFYRLGGDRFIVDQCLHALGEGFRGTECARANDQLAIGGGFRKIKTQRGLVAVGPRQLRFRDGAARLFVPAGVAAGIEV
jgi:hypothetical protein